MAQSSQSKAAAGLLGLSWDEIDGIMERAVRRGLQRRKAELVSRIGVDEKAFRKGHCYLTLMNDRIRGRVLYVADDRRQSSLDGFWETLTAEQISGIEAVAVDMWDPYLASVRGHVAKADRKIVFDKFNVAQHLGEAVDKVRRKEHKTLKATGDDRLTGRTTIDCGIRPPWNRRTGRSSPNCATASSNGAGVGTEGDGHSAIRIRLRASGAETLPLWHNWAVRSRLRPMIEVARMLQRRFENIITYLRHRITNATSESIMPSPVGEVHGQRFSQQAELCSPIYFHWGP